MLIASLIRYAGVFGGKMTTEFFGQLAKDEGFVNGATVFVATDELERRCAD